MKTSKANPEKAALQMDTLGNKLTAMLSVLEARTSQGFDVDRLTNAIYQAIETAHDTATDLRSPMRCVSCGNPRTAPHRSIQCTRQGEFYQNIS